MSSRSIYNVYWRSFGRVKRDGKIGKPRGSGFIPYCLSCDEERIKKEDVQFWCFSQVESRSFRASSRLPYPKT